MASNAQKMTDVDEQIGTNMGTTIRSRKTITPPVEELLTPFKDAIDHDAESQRGSDREAAIQETTPEKKTTNEEEIRHYRESRPYPNHAADP